MKIDKYNWQLDIDAQKTKLMYSNRLKSKIEARNQLPEFTWIVGMRF